MKPNYDFSQGDRGKFYHPHAQFELPIYLDADVAAAVTALATQSGREVETIVNEWLR
jgi:hypothetical protein